MVASCEKKRRFFCITSAIIHQVLLLSRTNNLFQHCLELKMVVFGSRLEYEKKADYSSGRSYGHDD